MLEDSIVRSWVKQFNEGSDQVHDEERSGRPSLVTDELVHAIEKKVQQNRKCKTSAFAMEFQQILRLLIHENVTEKLQFRKLYPRWVLKILTEQYQKQRISSSFQFLTHYSEDGDDFLSRIFTGDET